MIFDFILKQIKRNESIKKFYSHKLDILDSLTKSDKYGVNIRARPAATLQAPTPTLRMAVGYNSAV